MRRSKFYKVIRSIFSSEAFFLSLIVFLLVWSISVVGFLYSDLLIFPIFSFIGLVVVFLIVLVYWYIS